MQTVILVLQIIGLTFRCSCMKNRTSRKLQNSITFTATAVERQINKLSTNRILAATTKYLNKLKMLKQFRFYTSVDLRLQIDNLIDFNGYYALNRKNSLLTINSICNSIYIRFESMFQFK